MDGGEPILLDHALGDEDRILEVVAVPRHEGDQHVLAQGQFTQVRGRTVGHHVPPGHRIAGLYQRTLIDAGVLIGTDVFGQIVDIDAGLSGLGLVVVDAHHDTAGVHGIHRAAAAGHHGHARIHGHVALDTGPDQRFFGAQGRHRLTLHVGAHERAVGVVVLQERNQRGGHGHHLLGADVHEVHLVRRRQGEFIRMTARDQCVGQTAVLTQVGVGLGDDVFAFFNGGQVFDFVGHLAVGHLPIGTFQKTVFVGAGIRGQGVDQTDVRTFRGLDGTHPAVMRRVYVAHLETGALAGQAARTQRRDAALVGNFRQGVVLIHELGQLRRPEKLLHRRGHRLGVDQFLGHQAFGLGQTQTLFHGALDTHQADAKHVLRHLADATNAAVAQVVDVIHRAIAVADTHQGLDDINDVRGLAVFLDQLLGLLVVAATVVGMVIENARPLHRIPADAAIEFHTPDAGKVVTVGGEEQIVEQVLGRIRGRRFAGAHHAINLDQGFQFVAGGVDAQGIGNIRTAIQIVGVDRRQILDAGVQQPLQVLFGNFVVGGKQQFAVFAVRLGNIRGNHFADEEFRRHFHARYARLGDLLDVTHGDPPALLHQHFIAHLQIEGGDLSLEPLRDQIPSDLLAFEMKFVGLEEQRQNLLGAISQRMQEHGHRQLASPVDTHEDAVLGIEFEIQPRAAIRNHPGGKQQFPRGMGLAAIMVEEHPGRTMQLGDDDPLGAVDDEGAVVGHQRQFAHVDFLFPDFLDDLVVGLLIVNLQPQNHAQRGRVGQAANLAFLYVKGRRPETIGDIVQLRAARITGNGEHGFEGRMQTDLIHEFIEGRLAITAVIAPLRIRRPHFGGLQEFAIGIDLYRKQIGHIQDARTLSEILADAFFLSEAVRHRGSSTFENSFIRRPTPGLRPRTHA